jgi:D-amino peptidase
MERAYGGHRVVKVFIVSDMEGVAGIVKWEQTDGVKEKQAYHEGRALYTEEINAAVRGARTGGASEIVVMDCHGAGGEWNFNSLIPDKLDRGCEYVVQDHWTEYVDFLEKGCDAALFVGMHAKAGTPDGVLSHTVSGQAWRELKFNGVSVGETGINAALCGQWGCPVVLVTGDEAVCREGSELLGLGLTTVAVKKGLGRFSARQVPPLRAREMIENGARRALQDLSLVQPYDPGRPAEISVEFMTPDRVVEYHNRRGVEQVDELTLVSRADDWWTAWSQFYL